MSDSSENKYISKSEYPNILSLNKKLKDSLDELDARFKNLEKSIDLGYSNTEGRMDRLERCFEDRFSNTEKMFSKLQPTLDSQAKNRNNFKDVEADADQNISKEIQREQSEPSSSQLPKKERNSSPIKRDFQGRIQFSKSETNQNLTESEKFVKRAWPEAIFPENVQDDSYASAKNKVVLKPESRLVTAQVEVFEKPLQIQNAP